MFDGRDYHHKFEELCAKLSAWAPEDEVRSEMEQLEWILWEAIRGVFFLAAAIPALAASALLGQFSLALGAAAAAHWLIQILTNRTLSTGHVFTLPTAVIAGTVGCVAVLSASLPWYALAILAGIPIVARQVSQRAKSIRQQTPLPALATFAVAGAAIYVTWRVAGDVPF